MQRYHRGSSSSSREKPALGKHESYLTRRDVIALAAFGLVAGVPRPSFAAEPQGQLTWGIHVEWLAPRDRSKVLRPKMST